jgi:hypothetical protein
MAVLEDSRMTITPGDFPYDAQQSLTIPDGDAGVFATLQAMRALVEDAVRHSRLVRELAMRIGPMPRRGVLTNQLRTIYEFLRQYVRFRRDPIDVEHLRHPDQLAHEILCEGEAEGDCDEVATLAAALLRLFGYRPVFIVAGRKPAGRFEHVFYGVRDEAGNVFPLDSQHGHFGHMPPEAKRIDVFAL